MPEWIMLIASAWIHKVLEQLWKHFTSLKLCKCSQISHISPRVASTPPPPPPPTEQKPTIISLIIHKHFIYTKLHHLIRSRSEGKLLNPCGSKMKKWNLGLISLPHSTWSKPERERESFRFTQHTHFVQLHQEQKQKLLGR